MGIKESIHRLFETDLRKNGILEITVEELRALGVRIVAVDADNTSSHDRTAEPLPGAAEWIDSLKAAGFEVLLLSNASAKRAAVLADKFGISVVGFACKPLPFGFLRAAIRTKQPPRRICMVGDQLFTDILGANILGFKTAYVYPFKKEERNKYSFAARRAVEKKIFAHQDRKKAEQGTPEKV